MNENLKDVQYNRLLTLKNLSNGSVVEGLAEKLTNLILSGELPEGYVFPNENEFCSFLGIGRSTLRETYKVLEANGMITRSRKGTVVNNFDLIIASMPYDMVIGIVDYNEILVFRTAIEKESAGLAAQFATGDNIEHLESSLNGMQQNVDDVKKLTVYDTMFHLEIARASKNRLFSRTLNDIMISFSKTVSRNFMADVDIRYRAIDYHTKILDAIRAGDSAYA